MKRIVFATFGSLGDLHPYVAISQELVRRGHRPLIATFEEYRGAVEAAGIEFAPMRPSMSEFGDRTAMMERLIDPWRARPRSCTRAASARWRKRSPRGSRN